VEFAADGFDIALFQNRILALALPAHDPDATTRQWSKQVYG
jgi:hypothetical protein